MTSRELRRAVNRKRAQRVMREQRLLQRHRPSGRRRRPGFFRVERPGQLWHLDMTSVWVAGALVLSKRGNRLLNARDPGLGLDLRCRAQEALAVLERAVAAHGIEPGALTLGTDNGTAYTSRPFRARLAELGIVHRRGGYRDPESQAFIESWFSKLKEREVWRAEYETLEEARSRIGAYVERYHRRPHQFLGYRTPLEVAETWQDVDRLRKAAA